MINRWRIGLDRSKFALSRSWKILSSRKIWLIFLDFLYFRVCKKVRFFVHFSLLLIYYFFFSKLIFRHRTDYVEVWNTFFAAHESKICRVSMISKFNATESRKMAATLWIVVSLIPLPSNRCFIRILEYFVFEDENIV